MSPRVHHRGLLATLASIMRRCLLRAGEGAPSLWPLRCYGRLISAGRVAAEEALPIAGQPSLLALSLISDAPDGVQSPRPLFKLRRAHGAACCPLFAVLADMYCLIDSLQPTSVGMK
jgi:hypothetical protein